MNYALLINMYPVSCLLVAKLHIKTQTIKHFVNYFAIFTKKLSINQENKKQNDIFFVYALTSL